MTAAQPLRPTPARLALLRQIANPDVRVYAAMESPSVRRSWVEHHRNVTAVCDAMERADWIVLGPPTHASMYAKRNWELTDAGRAVLAAADESRKVDR